MTAGRRMRSARTIEPRPLPVVVQHVRILADESFDVGRASEHQGGRQG